MKLQKTATSKLTEREWQALRQSFVKRGMVGGSDAGTLLGLNPYSSPINLFYKAVNREPIPNKMNIAMYNGKNLEKYVAQCWQYYDGSDQSIVDNFLQKRKVKSYKSIKAIIQNPHYPALFANIDGTITKPKKGILEIKTISGYSSDQYAKGVPESYFAQVQLYMLVCRLEYAEIFYMKDGRSFGLVEVDANKEMQEAILDAANDHQQRVLAAQKEIVGYDGEDIYGVTGAFEPDVDGSDAYTYFLSEKHKARQVEGHMVSPEMEAEVDAYINAKKAEDDMANVKQLSGNIIKKYMEDNNVNKMTSGKYQISWRTQFRITTNNNE